MKASSDLVAAALLAAALASSPAHAVDGVTLIDQSKVLAGNVTPGDAPGFPITITQPGSYRLSGPLKVDDPLLSGIVIQADNVRIDLNGFAITGGRCAGSRCYTGPATATGIDAFGHLGANVGNGAIGFFHGDGLALSTAGRAANLRLHRNAGCGARLAYDALIRDSVIETNIGCGTHMSWGSHLRNSTVARNGGWQASGSGEAFISGNVLRGVQLTRLVVSAGDNLCVTAEHTAAKC